MTKVKLDIGTEIDFLNKGELDDALSENQKRATAIEREKLKGVKYIRAPRIQGTVYNGTIGGSSTTLGTQALGGPPWGPQQGYAWSVRRIAVGGLANVNGTSPDVVGIYRNNTSSPPVAQVTANAPMVTFPTLGCTLLGGDSLLLGQVPNQISSNTTGTLTATFIQADFDVIEVPAEMLGKLA